MSEGVLVFSWTPQALIATSDSATTNGALTHHHGQWRFTGCCWSLNASPYKPDEETSKSRAMRMTSKFAHSAAINANLSALVASKRSTLRLFPIMENSP